MLRGCMRSLRWIILEKNETDRKADVEKERKRQAVLQRMPIPHPLQYCLSFSLEETSRNLTIS